MKPNPRNIPTLRELSLLLLEGLKVRNKPLSPIYDELITLWEETRRQYTKRPASRRTNVTRDKLENAWLLYQQNTSLSSIDLCKQADISEESQGRVSAYIKEKVLGHKPLRH